MMATEMPAAINPYSMAVAPDAKDSISFVSRPPQPEPELAFEEKPFRGGAFILRGFCKGKRVGGSSATNFNFLKYMFYNMTQRNN